MRCSISIPFFRSRLIAWHIGFGCVCTAFPGHAFGDAYTTQPFDHYQPILDRMPFGAPPSSLDAAASDPATQKAEAQVKADQQALSKKINMSAVNVTPDGQTALGFTDLSQNPPINYYLLVGATAGGWTVISADYDEETATIKKDDVSITLKLGKGLVEPAPTKSAIIRPPVSLVTRPSVPLVSRPSTVDTRSYAERQRERATQQTASQLAAEARQREQLEALAREAAVTEIKRREEENVQATQPQAEEPQVQQIQQGQVQ